MRFLRRRGGAIPFDAVREVAVESPLGDEGIPSRRVVLVLEDRRVPLTVVFEPDPSDVRLQLGDEIRRVIGAEDPVAASDDALMASVRAAVRAGDDLEAIRLLRGSRDLGLTAAKDLVDEIKEGGGRP